MEQLQATRQDRFTWIAGAHDVRLPLTRIQQRPDSSAFWIDSQFISMLAVYRPSGGIARCHELEARLAARLKVGRQGLTRWLHDCEVFAFEWRQEAWMPVFQLESTTLTPRSGVQQIADELRPVFDSWELAVWFAEPNASLDGHAPVACIDHDRSAVRQAARMDRQAYDNARNALARNLSHNKPAARFAIQG